jgi:DNA (cytosine-5)-methyltransferase 1
MSQLSFADLFSGCGGLSLGLSLAGLSGRFAIERDPMAFGTFAANFLSRDGSVAGFEWPAWLEQKAWDIAELLTLHKDNLFRLRGTIDVLAGGPPCQGFSFAGRRQEGDPRNLLFEKYVEVVRAIKPQVLVFENVPGMKVIHRRRNVLNFVSAVEDAAQQSFFDRLVESLDNAGYIVEGELVDASLFGVPQRRSRLIAIGIRKDLLHWVDGGIRRAFDLIEAAGPAQVAELGLNVPVTAEDALSDLELARTSLVPCDDPESPPHFTEGAYLAPRTRYQHLMHENSSGKMTSMRLARHRDDVRDRFSRIISECRKGVRMDEASLKTYGLKKHRIFPMAAGEAAPTITTLPDDILHYSEPRILTVRECARLQSFPDWFRFSGNFTSGGDRRKNECPRYTQVGNAVPPYLARALGTALSAVMEEVSQRRRAFESASAEFPRAAIA